LRPAQKEKPPPRIPLFRQTCLEKGNDQTAKTSYLIGHITWCDRLEKEKQAWHKQWDKWHRESGRPEVGKGARPSILFRESQPDHYHRWNTMPGPGTQSAQDNRDAMEPPISRATPASDWRHKSRVALRGTASMPSLPAARGTISVANHSHMLPLMHSELAARQWHKALPEDTFSTLRSDLNCPARDRS
jgi:hypothetical protein